MNEENRADGEGGSKKSSEVKPTVEEVTFAEIVTKIAMRGTLGKLVEDDLWGELHEIHGKGVRVFSLMEEDSTIAKGYRQYLEKTGAVLTPVISTPVSTLSTIAPNVYSWDGATDRLSVVMGLCSQIVRESCQQLVAIVDEKLRKEGTPFQPRWPQDTSIKFARRSLFFGFFRGLKA